MAALGWAAFGGVHHLALSIVTVVRRDFAGLERTLASLGQLDHRVEVVVIEGDDTIWAESERLQDRFRQRLPSLRWLRQPDNGIYAAMNKGVMMAAGRWVWFLNAGDSSTSPTSLTSLIDLLGGVADGSEWVLGNTNVRDSTGTLLRVKPAADYSAAQLLLGTYTPCHQAVITSRAALARHGGFDTRYSVAADYRLFLQLVSAGSHPEPLAFDVNFLHGGKSHQARARSVREYARARNEVLGRRPAAGAQDSLRSVARSLVPNPVAEARARLKEGRQSSLGG